MKNKVKALVFGCLLAAGAVAGILTFGSSAASASGPSRDHALFDQTSGDTGATCKSIGAFSFDAAVRAINGDGVLRVRFQDRDFVDYPIPNDTSFSLTQFAGDTRAVDRILHVGSAPGSAGQLVGWVSASGRSPVSCYSTP